MFSSKYGKCQSGSISATPSAEMNRVEMTFAIAVVPSSTGDVGRWTAASAEPHRPAADPFKPPRSSSTQPHRPAARSRSTSRPDGRPTPWSGRPSGAVAVSLAEHLHLGVGLVDVDRDVVELLDELLD